jgi:hypothetical protein
VGVRDAGPATLIDRAAPSDCTPVTTDGTYPQQCAPDTTNDSATVTVTAS